MPDLRDALPLFWYPEDLRHCPQGPKPVGAGGRAMARIAASSMARGRIDSAPISSVSRQAVAAPGAASTRVSMDQPRQDRGALGTGGPGDFRSLGHHCLFTARTVAAAIRLSADAVDPAIIEGHRVPSRQDRQTLSAPRDKRGLRALRIHRLVEAAGLGGERRTATPALARGADISPQADFRCSFDSEPAIQRNP